MDATEKHSEAVWDHKLTRHVQSEILKEKQQEQILREYRRQLMEENKKLALQQKNLQKHLNQNVYRGVTSNDFFSQFGQSCR